MFSQAAWSPYTCRASKTCMPQLTGVAILCGGFWVSLLTILARKNHSMLVSALRWATQGSLLLFFQHVSCPDMPRLTLIYSISGSVVDCGVDPRQPCKTYKVFGKSAPLHPFDKSMVCTEPDALADMFNLTSFLTESRTIVVQPSRA